MPTSIERINQKFNKLNKVGAYRPKKVDLRAHVTRVREPRENSPD